MHSPPPVKARWSLLVLFFVCGVLAASWVPYIADLQTRHSLEPGRLGFILLARAIGSIVVLPLAAWAVPALGARRSMVIAVCLACFAIVFPLAAPNVPLLALALFYYGAATSIFSVCINAQAVVVEQRYGRPIMSSFHAQYSVGLVVGSLVQLACAHARVLALWHLSLVALTVFAASTLFIPALLDHRRTERDGQDPPVAARALRFSIPHGVLGVLAVLCFCDMIGENCSGDWGSIYLQRVIGMPAALGGAAFAAYSVAMTASRLCGDRLVSQYGGVRILQYSGLLSGLGLGCALLLHTPLTALAGFACLGAGVANVVPILYSRSGRIPDLEPSFAIAILTTSGNCGLLAGPALIGMTAQAFGMGDALFVVVLSSLFVAGFAARTADEPMALDRMV